MLALRAQLEPHFLFNALNAISALVRAGDKPVALAGIGRLSTLLRYALAASTDQTATLAAELQFVRDYLETLDWDKSPPGPRLPDDEIAKTRMKYAEALERLASISID